MPRLRPGRELVDREYYAPETIGFWRRAVAAVQLAAAERNLAILAQVQATPTGVPWRFWAGRAMLGADFDRLRAGILERKRFWARAAQ